MNKVVVYDIMIFYIVGLFLMGFMAAFSFVS